jgi:hypothetical protein
LTRAPCHWFRLTETDHRRQSLIDSVVSDVTTSRGGIAHGPEDLRLLEQVPRDGVDQGNDEANHQPLHRAYPTQACGKRPRQAEGRSASGLDSPRKTKCAQDHQTDQCERVESEGRLNVPVEQCVTHPRPPAQRAVPTGQKAERTGQREPGRRVQRAESQPTSKKSADVPGCTGGPK